MKATPPAAYRRLRLMIFAIVTLLAAAYQPGATKQLRDNPWLQRSES